VTVNVVENQAKPLAVGVTLPLLSSRASTSDPRLERLSMLGVERAASHLGQIEDREVKAAIGGRMRVSETIPDFSTDLSPDGIAARLGMMSAR